MDTSHKEINSYISILLHSMRKHRGLTQQDVADFVHISQSNYSKMERGILTPSVKEWALFCELTKIPVDSVVKGFIDEGKSIPEDEKYPVSRFKFPKEYTQGSSFSARSARIFLNYARKNGSLDDFKKKIKSECGFEVGYLSALTNPLTPKFLTDFGHFTMNTFNVDLEQIFSSAFHDEFVHGDLHTLYRNATSLQEVMRIYVDHGHLYDRYYKREIVLSTPTCVKIALKSTQVSLSEVMVPKSFLDEFNRCYLQGIARYAEFDNLQIEKETVEDATIFTIQKV